MSTDTLIEGIPTGILKEGYRGEGDNGLGGIEGWGGLEIQEGRMIADSGTQI